MNDPIQSTANASQAAEGTAPEPRIIVIDDNHSIHRDFREILGAPEDTSDLDELEADLFGEQSGPGDGLTANFDLCLASQGKEGVDIIAAAKREGRPISVAFVDMRMPPGWDGLQTIEEIWKVDPEVQVVICSAFSDYSWREVLDRLGRTERLLILKKPFDTAEVGQLANALSEKWSLSRQAAMRMVELEKLVDERTIKLQEAVSVAEESNKAKGMFLANMSHEIRTPVNGIMGIAELLCDSGLEGETLDFAKTIFSSSHSLLNVINDVLDVSKIESGKMELEDTVYRLSDVLDQVTTILRPRGDLDGPKLLLEVDPSTPDRIVGDPHRLQQVLFNLIGNALKFTKQGHVKLRASLRPANSEQAERIWIEVEDTGIGIAAEALDRIFETFTQADGTTTRRFGGTGLGLSISRHLVLLMGGSIVVQSTPGQGSTFRVDLPVQRAPRDAGVLQADADGDKTIDAIDAHVLLVEDNPVNQRVALKMLELLGVRVEVAGDGRQAVKAVEQQLFDLILMDWQMPVLDGLGATREIIALGSDMAKIPIIAMTANAMAGDRETCIEAGMVGYISKPISRKRLGQALAAHLPAKCVTYKAE